MNDTITVRVIGGFMLLSMSNMLDYLFGQASIADNADVSGCSLSSGAEVRTACNFYSSK